MTNTKIMEQDEYPQNGGMGVISRRDRPETGRVSEVNTPNRPVMSALEVQEKLISEVHGLMNALENRLDSVLEFAEKETVDKDPIREKLVRVAERIADNTEGVRRIARRLDGILDRLQV